MTGRMAGKRVIITGGAGGIGAVTGEVFASEGARIVLFDANHALLETVMGNIKLRNPQADISGVAGDVSDFAAAQRAVAYAVDRFGGLDSLVCNAAVRHHASVENTLAEDWQRVMSINLIGAANFCRAAIGSLRANGNGAVVIVSSGYGLTGRKGSPVYDASKAALLSLMRTLACEEVDNGVRVNAICPGSTATPFTIGRGRARGLSEEQFYAEVRSDSLMKRWARPQEVAYPIMWLASDEASYMTGSTLMVDGGLSIM